MGKHEKKKQQILDTAFEVWGRSFYYKTNLSSLAEAVGITKPGLYRYFRSKDEILDAMKKDVIQRHLGFISELKGKEFSDLDNLVKVYTGSMIRFFASNYNHYLFLVQMMINTPEGEGMASEAFSMKGRNFLNSSMLTRFGFSEIEAETIVNYILSVSGFILSNRFFNSVSLKKPEIEKMVKVVLFIINHGLYGRAQNTDYSMVESKIVIKESDILPYNRIFTAVAEVIAEKGVWGTTVDAVAEHLGMTKSSLYFYFDNKEQMIKDVIQSEVVRLNELVIERITLFESVEDQIYCIITVMSRYFYLKPSIFSIIKWLRFQFIDKPLNDPPHRMDEFMEYIDHISKNSGFNPIGFNSGLIAKGFSFILIHELWEDISWDLEADIIRNKLRIMYRLLMNGLKGI